MKQRTSSVSSLSLLRSLLQRYVHDENLRFASTEVAGIVSKTIAMDRDILIRIQFQNIFRDSRDLANQSRD